MIFDLSRHQKSLLDDILISIGIDFCATDLVFEPIESRTQVRHRRKVLAYVYVSNLEVLDLIEHIS